MLSTLRQDCPNCTLTFAPESDDPASDALRQDVIDLYIGATDTLKSEIRRQTLLRDKMRALVRRDHPILSEKITPQSLTRYNHISVSRRGRARGPIDTALKQEHGLTRRVILTVPTYHAMIENMRDTDMILALPGMVIDHISVEKLGLTAFDFPSDFRRSMHIRPGIHVGTPTPHIAGCARLYSALPRMFGKRFKTGC